MDYSTSVEKATLLNDFFAKQCSIVAPPCALPPLRAVTQSRLHKIDTNSDDVRKFLLGLDVGKASGPDGISTRLLKNISDSVCHQLSDLYNFSLSTGEFPSLWKQANVTPIYKKGDNQNKANYRPVSLISVVGKVLERIVFTHMYEYCSTNGLLTWRNSGFKPFDSAMNQLVMLTHKIYQNFDQHTDVCMVFMDVAKAFDKVWHTGLVHKLQTLGFESSILKWLTNYLSNRAQKVVIQGQQSPLMDIEAGVPQGSILGPLLFI